MTGLIRIEPLDLHPDWVAIYLYTSGTLPRYYAGLGWVTTERLDYLGTERTVMRHDLGSEVGIGRRGGGSGRDD